MKKIVVLLLILPLGFATLAQDAASKKFQGGLVAGFGLNFQNMGTKYLEKDGVGTDLLIGGNINTMFNETIGLTTGIEFEFSKTKFKTGPNLLMYYYNDTKIVGIEDYDSDPSNAKSIFLLQERKQQSVYLTVPTMLIFKTKFIGYVRYFGKFGMRHGFLLSQKVEDKGYTETINDFDLTNLGASVSQKNMKSKNSVVFYKGSVGIAGGAEWNFTGSTCLSAEIGYYYGITPLYYNRDNAYLFTNETDASGNVTRKGVSNKATQGQLQLKVSILF